MADTTSRDELSTVFRRMRAGESFAFDDLMPLVFGELRGLASRYMRREAAKHTLQATALVNEVYFKLKKRPVVDWEGRTHFFATAANAMRQVLVDHARAAKRDKRGGGWNRQELDEDTPAEQEPTLDLIDLNEALERLGREAPRKLQVVEMRYFVGMTNREIAEVLGVDTRTVERDWAFAQAWLARELS